MRADSFEGPYSVIARNACGPGEDMYLLRPTLMYKPKDLNRDWSPHFSMLRDKNGWIRAKTPGNLNLGVSRNRFLRFSS